MQGEYAALSYIQLQPQTAYTHPPEPPGYVYLDSPALDVMTDFNLVYPLTIKAEVSIDDALEHMKTSGVRLLLVTDETELIVGLITAKDIQGEKPVKVAEASRISRAQITVGMIMTSQQDVMAFNVISVRNAQVGTYRGDIESARAPAHAGGGSRPGREMSGAAGSFLDQSDQQAASSRCSPSSGRRQLSRRDGPRNQLSRPKARSGPRAHWQTQVEAFSLVTLTQYPQPGSETRRDRCRPAAAIVCPRPLLTLGKCPRQMRRVIR